MSQPISSPRIVGRRRELAAMDQLLAQARGDDGVLCVLSGEAGVGKTRLVRELEFRAAVAGMRCLRGQCLAVEGGDVPFAPLADVFGDLAASQGSAAPEVLQILFGAAGLAVPAEPVVPARAHAALLQVLRRAAAEQPTAIVIEDVHWADRSTLAFLSALAQRLGRDRLAVIATFRSDELARDDPARALVGELMRGDRVVHLSLERLSREETSEQLAAIAGRPVPRAGEIFERTGGNPFLTEQLWAAGDRGPLPPTLGDALLARVRALPEDAQRVVRLLAVFGRPAGRELLLADDSVSLRRAIDDHILEPRGDRLAFRHSLVREALYRELVPGEREELHSAVLRALAAHGAGPAELAHHHLAAGHLADALGASVEAGMEAARRAGYPEALGHFERALALWEQVQPDSAAGLDRVDVHREAAEAGRLAGEYDRAAEHCRAALEILDIGSEPVRAAGFFERLCRYESWDLDRSLAAAERALALLGPEPSPERARSLTGLAQQQAMRGHWHDARASADDALAIAEASGARVEECAARTQLGLALAFDGEPEAGERCLRHAVRLAAEAHAPEELARAYTNLAEVERLGGRIDAAWEAMREGGERVGAMGLGASWGAFMAVVSADDLLHLGRWADLDALLDATREVNAGRAGAVMWPLVAGRLALARGRLEPALELLETARARALRGVTPELIPHVGAALAELRLAQHDPAAARAHVEEAHRLAGERDDPLNAPPLLYAAVRAEAEMGARDRAEDAVARLEALAGPPQATAWRDQARGELAGDPVPHWAAAAAAWDAISDPHRAAYARFREADALLSGGRRRAEAAGALHRAAAGARELGATPLLRDIEALARRARLTLDDGSAPAPAAHGLTRREAEVLALVADGLTNRQIAERLFITPKTAGLHVSHILAKLNVDSRVKAAAIAHRSQPEEARECV